MRPASPDGDGYTVATALGAIPLARLTTGWDRRRVLQVALAVGDDH